MECPTDETFRLLLTNALPNEATQPIDRHLTECDRCQQRLESLANVAEFSSMRMPVGDSGDLRNAILDLEQIVSNSIPKRLTDIPQLPPSSNPDSLGRLGDIDILRVIGRGSMGIVFEGYDTVLSRSVAVKVLSPHLLHDDEARNRFVREAQSAASLTHVNVVAIYGINANDTLPYLVLQFVAGESLSAKFKRAGALPYTEVVRIGIQIARGLESAHSQGLIHRDIKPANILLDTDGNVRITDFGLAKCVGSETLTEVGTIAGTPAYMSPEQAEGGAIDARSDLFSLGVMLYQLSSGKLPFEADSPYVLLDMIRREEPVQLKKIKNDLPNWFCMIVHQLLDKRPEERLGSASELAEILTYAQAPRRKKRSVIASRLVSLGIAASLIAAAVYFFVINRPDATLQGNTETLGFKPTQGFRILYVRDSQEVVEPTIYTNLNDAFANARDKAVILVSGDGPFETRSITIENGRDLTIRALPGSTPKIIPDRNERNAAHFLQTNGDLRLEGLEIDWPKSFAAAQEDGSLRGVVQSTQGRLTVSYCRISCGLGNACIGSAGRDLTVNHCQLQSKVGSCVNWRPNFSPAKIEHCILTGGNGLTINPGLGKQPARGIVVAHNIIFCERAITLILNNSLPRQTVIEAHANIMACHNVVALSAMRNYQKNLDTPTEINGNLNRLVRWTERENVYRPVVSYVAGSRAGQPLNSIPSDMRDLNVWLRYWNLNNTGSVTAEIRVSEVAGETETTITNPVGKLPDTTGPQSRIGPGIPYHTR